VDFLLTEISKLMESKLGIILTPDKFSLYEVNLKSKSKLINKLPIPEYISFLKDTSILEEPEWKIVIRALNISETYFFRDLGQIELLEKTLFPKIIEKCKSKKEISIWSAGCSTGEEAYSISMILHKLIPDIASWNIRILASDLDSNSIEVARKGDYFDWSFRNISEDDHKNFFIKQKDRYSIRDNLRRNIEFKNENLISANYLNRFDLVICRNVFIYLNDSTKEKILTNFANAMMIDAYLVLGHSEAGPKIPNDLEVVIDKNSIYYKKKGLTTQSAFTLPEVSTKTLKDNPVYKLPETYTADLERKNILLAGEYANKGDFTSAKNYCKAAIAISENNFEAHYLMGQIYESEGRHTDAILNYEKVILTNKCFLEAYLSLASLYNLLGKQDFSLSIRNKGLIILDENRKLQNEYTLKGFNINSFRSFFKNESAIWF
jgi:chemotaxis protein methyltransferase CheR